MKEEQAQEEGMKNRRMEHQIKKKRKFLCTKGNKRSEVDESSELEEKIEWKRELVEWVKTIAICALAAFFINTFILLNANVPSSSMENTIMEKDRLFANRLAYVFDEPERFDIIVFKFPDDEKTLFVKRIIGIEGDTVEIVDGIVFINGEPIKDTYKKEKAYGSYGPVTVPEGHYFTLGDNRNNSADSREWINTFVPRDNIVAKPIFRYWPNFKDLRYEQYKTLNNSQ